MSRPYPRICATCRERSVQPVTLSSYSTNVEHDGRSYAITLADVSGTQCDNCGALILDDSVADRIDDQLREQAGLLRPTEIRSHRLALGLTQKDLAQKLLIGEATLSRWETGAQIQQRSLDLLLRLCFELVDVRRYLGVSLPEQLPRSEATHDAGAFRGCR